jgi:hypothetical protein
MTTKFMPWIDFLPEVGTPILAERDRMAGVLAEADQLEQQAAALRAGVRWTRADLFDRIAKKWTLFDIETAARRAGNDGNDGQRLPVDFVTDPKLREALRALDGGLFPLAALQAFERGQVVRQHNLLSTATDAECRETLNRVLDWWNFAAVPVLSGDK